MNSPCTQLKKDKKDGEVIAEVEIHAGTAVI